MDQSDAFKAANAIPKFISIGDGHSDHALEATIAFHSDAVVGSASGKNHSGCQSPERDTEANDELSSPGARIGKRRHNDDTSITRATPRGLVLVSGGYGSIAG